MSSSELTIDAADLRIVLEGDAQRIAEAYESLRPVVVDQLQTAMRQQSAHHPHVDLRPCQDPDATQPMHRPGDLINNRSDAERIRNEKLAQRQCRFVAYNDMCRQVAFFKREEFEKSLFAPFVDYTQVHTFHISGEAVRQLEENIELGTPLWRELTRQGQAAISEVSDDGESP